MITDLSVRWHPVVNPQTGENLYTTRSTYKRDGVPMSSNAPIYLTVDEMRIYLETQTTLAKEST